MDVLKDLIELVHHQTQDLDVDNNLEDEFKALKHQMIDDLKEIKKLKKEKYELKKKQDELTGNNQRTKETIKESKKHKKNVEKEIENHKKSKEALKAELEEEKQLCELIGLDYKQINNDEFELKYSKIVAKTPAKTFTFQITTKDNQVKIIESDPKDAFDWNLIEQSFDGSEEIDMKKLIVMIHFNLKKKFDIE